MSKYFTKEEEEKNINDFIELLKFETISATGPTTGEYEKCSKFLFEKLTELDMNPIIIEKNDLPKGAKKPIVLGEWIGSDPSLPVILLNGHYDVVPPQEDFLNPFNPIRKDSKIYARGTQDMKCVLIQYLIALKKLKQKNFKPQRTICVSFVPDEEIGGVDGMSYLLSSRWFTNKKFGIALDEGIANTDNTYTIFYGERVPWRLKLTSKGVSAHGSKLIHSTAVEKLLDVVNKAMDFRTQQKNLLYENETAGKSKTEENSDYSVGCTHCIVKKNRKLGDVTTLNLNILEAGVKAGDQYTYNMIPPKAEATFDIRIAPQLDPLDMVNMWDQWCHEIRKKHNESDNEDEVEDNGNKRKYTPEENFERNSKKSVYWTIEPKSNFPLKHHNTPIDEKKNPFISSFDLLKDKYNVNISPEIFPAATDSRFLRALGVKAIGFSPIRNSEICLHEVDEHIHERVFLDGCDVYVDLIESLSLTPLSESEN